MYSSSFQFAAGPMTFTVACTNTQYVASLIARHQLLFSQHPRQPPALLSCCLPAYPFHAVQCLSSIIRLSQDQDLSVSASDASEDVRPSSPASATARTPVHTGPACAPCDFENPSQGVTRAGPPRALLRPNGSERSRPKRSQKTWRCDSWLAGKGTMPMWSCWWRWRCQAPLCIPPAVCGIS